MIQHQPNILVFIPHDLGDFLGCYGHATVCSPNLDALAARGVRFSNCFAPSPECTPSRSGLWTGQYPHQNGLMGLANFGWELRTPHLAERLRQAGYRTHLFGFQHEIHHSPELLGYDQCHSQNNFNVNAVCHTLTAFLRSSEATDKTPWFACAGFSDVHRPWRKPSRFAPEKIDVPPYLPDTPAIRSDLALFHQNIFDMDQAIGNVMRELHATGIDQDTLILFTTDHGIPFPRAKATLYDPGIRVSLILYWPGVIEGGVVHDCLLSNLDVTPTLLDICACDIPEGLAGHSFRALLEKRSYKPRDAVYGALFYDVAYDPMHYVRTRTHKYIRSFAVTDSDAVGADPEVLSTFAAGQWIRVDDYDVLSSAAWRSMAHSTPKPPREELYDLINDPREQVNLVDDPDAMPVLSQMRNLLSGMMERTDSPLLHGHVPPPAIQRDANRKYRPGGPMYRDLTD